MVGAADDECANAGLVSPLVHQSAGLLFLVRADPSQFALHLSSVSGRKDGQVHADRHGKPTKLRLTSLCVSDIEISEVVSRPDRDAFIRFPWKVYAHDPAWVPPLI